MVEEYSKLISETKKYITQEYTLDEHITIEEENNTLFKPSPRQKLEPSRDLNAVRQNIQKSNPNVTFLKSFPKKPPNLPNIDSAAVAVLVSNTNTEHYNFIVKVAEAINKQLAPTTLINIESFSSRDHLKLIIASKTQLPPPLKQNIQTLNNQHFLGKIPLLLMHDIDLYLNNPEHKRTLWQDLIKILGRKAS